jgi:iron complex outermembrane receptor protein
LLRPEFQASLIVDWIFADAWDLYFEIRQLGTALDEDEDGSVVELPTSTELNLRLFKTLHHGTSGRWRAYAGVENASDEIVLPQLGLPQPGRTVSLGASFERL